VELTADADLVRTALLGDKDALGVLIRRHWQTALFLAARVLGSPELAGDAVQEAAIAAMTSLDRLKSPDKFGAWFCGITLNVSRRWLRQLSSELPGLDAELASDEPGPAEAAELADIAARVRGAIRLLADGQAEAVSLFYLQGLSHREVAAELGISSGAVKARLHQARAALAPKLAGIAGPSGRKTMTGSQTALEPDWVDATVTEIRLHRTEQDEAGHHIMVLTEAEGGRQLPIWIGPAEAMAMAVALESTEIPRPFTYQLAASLVSASGARISEARITRLEPPIFYATVIVDGPGGAKAVDARPSDAVNLALTAGVPIRVDKVLFEPGATSPDAPQLEDCPVITSDLADAVVKSFTALSDD
jgi:RNA polymerase sigma factor (sigma-70 family)